MVGVGRTSDPEIDEQVRIFGENMRLARLRAGLSQIGLAQASRLDRAAVSFLERAQRSPDLRTLVRVAGAVGLAPAELLAGIGASRMRPARAANSRGLGAAGRGRGAVRGEPTLGAAPGGALPGSARLRGTGGPGGHQRLRARPPRAQPAHAC